MGLSFVLVMNTYSTLILSHIFLLFELKFYTIISYIVSSYLDFTCKTYLVLGLQDGRSWKKIEEK